MASFDQKSFSKVDQLTRACDLVMRGGITSGVVYPRAICRIAEHFALVSIAGTSAGAIAASLASAAEYQRRHGSGAGFEELAKIPEEIGASGRLLGLFQPDIRTRPLHGLLVDRLALNTSVKGFFPKLSRLLKTGWWFARVAGTVLRTKSAARDLVANGCGLCSGMAEGNRHPAGFPALTPWLSSTINRLAGRRQDDKPLTFGDLWTAPVPQPLESTMAPLAGEQHRSIDFRAVTTCLTFGRPFELPFASRQFFFDVDEWSRLFPDNVVKHLIARSGAEDQPHSDSRKLRLPEGHDMPIVVAARMSLSFPGLVSMVPLWAVDYDIPKDAEGHRPLKRVWFSDGGITSNFPVHRFDSPVPRWPTLAINLRYATKGIPPRQVDRETMVYLPPTRSVGSQDAWQPLPIEPTAPEPSAIFRFVGAIFSSAQNWHDNSYLKLPGFRDRFAEVWLLPSEGGMNLNMPPRDILRLAERGDLCGELLMERFGPAGDETEMGWPAHRWTRIRTSMAALMGHLQNLRQGAQQPLPDDLGLQALLSPDALRTHAYSMSDGQRAHCGRVVSQLLAIATECYENRKSDIDDGRSSPFDRGPRPPASIGTRPPM